MIICIFLFSFIFSYSDYMPPGFVGAPSQNSCTACHGDAGNDGELRVLGLPDNIIPGETYRIDVQILTHIPILPIGVFKLLLYLIYLVVPKVQIWFKEVLCQSLIIILY